MKPQNNLQTQKKRAIEMGEPVMVRLQRDQIAFVDKLRRKQDDLPSRPEMVRRLLRKCAEQDA